MSNEQEPPRLDIFSLGGTSIRFMWHPPLSAADFEDIQIWLKIVERKIGRAVKLSAQPMDPVDPAKGGE